MRSSIFVLAVVLAGCDPMGGPRLATAADSLAYRVTEGSGGLKAWDALPVLAFEWAVVRDSAEAVRTYHLWDKKGDRYRVEWPVGEDSVAVAVFAPSRFDPDAPEGQAAVNGQALAGTALADRLGEAYSRFINDSYWLLAPLKTLDPGVVRSVDMSTGMPVLSLAFESVGLTPGDRYWIDVDTASGAMTGWTYQLQDDSTQNHWDWIEPIEIETPHGPLTLPTMKVKDDGTVILTEPRAVVAVDEAAFADLAPRGARVEVDA